MDTPPAITLWDTATSASDTPASDTLVWLDWDTPASDTPALDTQDTPSSDTMESVMLRLTLTTASDTLSVDTLAWDTRGSDTLDRSRTHLLPAILTSCRSRQKSREWRYSWG